MSDTEASSRSQVFRGWLRFILGPTEGSLEDYSALQSGVVLLRFIEIATQSKLEVPYHVNPSSRGEALDNLRVLLTYLQRLGMPPSIVDVQDLYEGRIDRINDLLWFLVRWYYLHIVLHYKAFTTEMFREYLLTSIRDRLKDFLSQGIIVDNLSRSWQDGRAFCALVCSYSRKLLNFSATPERDDKIDASLTRTFATAEGRLGVPILLTASMLRRSVDEQSVSTYLAVFLHVAKITSTVARSASKSSAKGLMGSSLLDRLSVARSRVEALLLSQKTLQLEWDEATAKNIELKEARGRTRVSKDEVVSSASEASSELDFARHAYEENQHRSHADEQALEVHLGELKGKLDNIRYENEKIAHQMEGLIHKMRFVATDQAAKNREEVGSGAPTGWVCLMLTDVENSTNMWEENPDVMQEALDLHNAVLRENILKFRGFEVRTEGDAFVAAFGSCLAAVNCALSIQSQLVTATWPERLVNSRKYSVLERGTDGEILFRGIRVRIGLHAGIPNCAPDPVTGRMDYTGPMVNLAGRVQAAGYGGQTAITETVWNDIKESLADCGNPISQELGIFTFKGLGTEVLMHQLLPRHLGGRKFPPPKGTDVSNRGGAGKAEALSALEMQHQQLTDQMSGIEERFSTAYSSAKKLEDSILSMGRHLSTLYANERALGSGSSFEIDYSLLLMTQLLEDCQRLTNEIESLNRVRAQKERDLREVHDAKKTIDTQIARRRQTDMNTTHGARGVTPVETETELTNTLSELENHHQSLERTISQLSAEIHAERRLLGTVK